MQQAAVVAQVDYLQLESGSHDTSDILHQNWLKRVWAACTLLWQYLIRVHCLLALSIFSNTDMQSFRLLPVKPELHHWILPTSDHEWLRYGDIQHLSRRISTWVATYSMYISLAYIIIGNPKKLPLIAHFPALRSRKDALLLEKSNY